jgi:two-component system OmpR family response regulator
MHSVSLVERTRRVLVVDDSPHIVELIVTRLRLAGLETQVARNGQEAIQRLGEFRPEAMVLDINMPILDGFGVLAYMQTNGLSAKIPTMVLTANNNAADVAKAVKLGARDYLSKPFKDALLVQRVGRLLSRPRAAA